MSFLRNAGKAVKRSQEKMLQKFGKSEVTTDDTYAEHVANFTLQHEKTERLLRDVRAYIKALKVVSVASKTLLDTVKVVYEPDWRDSDAVYARVEALDVQHTQLQETLTQSAAEPLAAYLDKFPEIKTRMSKRDRKVVDYDRCRREYDTAKQKASPKLSQFEEAFEDAEASFNDINEELHNFLPQFFQQRVSTFSSLFQAIFVAHLEFHQSSAKVTTSLCGTMQQVGSKAQAAHRPSPPAPLTASASAPALSLAASPSAVSAPVIPASTPSNSPALAPAVEAPSTASTTTAATSLGPVAGPRPAPRPAAPTSTSTSTSSLPPSASASSLPPFTYTSALPASTSTSALPASTTASTSALPPSTSTSTSAPPSSTSTSAQAGSAVQEAPRASLAFPPSAATALAAVSSAVSHVVASDSDTDLETDDSDSELPPKQPHVSTPTQEDVAPAPNRQEEAPAPTQDEQQQEDSAHADETLDRHDAPDDVIEVRIALHPYEAQMEDELAFERGDLIDVVPLINPEDYDDGWAKGRCQGREGIFPLNFTAIHH
eukprot:m.142103 g.142103  ORF g.142103 m.142103 type:complete len:545 (-) comp52611_c0_seq5:92-1726(-)